MRFRLQVVGHKMWGQKPEEAHLAPSLHLPTVPDTYIESQATRRTPHLHLYMSCRHDFVQRFFWTFASVQDSGHENTHCKICCVSLLEVQKCNFWNNNVVDVLLLLLLLLVVWCQAWNSGAAEAQAVATSQAMPLLGNTNTNYKYKYEYKYKNKFQSSISASCCHKSSNAGARQYKYKLQIQIWI